MKNTKMLSNNQTVSIAYQNIFKIGAIAALIAAVLFRRNLDAEWWLLRNIGIVQAGPEKAPDTIMGWFLLLQNNQLLGLTLLNLFDLVNYALVGLIFLALLVALWQTNRSWMVMAATFGLVGITTYLTSNQAFTLLSLSQHYAAATTDSQRGMYLAAGQAVLAIHQNDSYAGRGIYLSFLFISMSGLLISIVMLHSSIFNKGTAFMGILAHGFGLGYYVSLVFAPSFVFIPISISAIFLLIWYLQVSRQLWALGISGIIGPFQEPISNERMEPQEENVFQAL